MALALYDPDGFSRPPRPRHWPVLEIARRRRCNESQTELLVWLFCRLGYRPGTLAFDRVDTIRDGACSSESQFRRALDGLERAGLVQRDRERSQPGRDVVHVLRAYQPELQQFFDFDASQSDTFFCDDRATSTSTSTSLGCYVPPLDAAADGASLDGHEPCEPSVGSGMDAAKDVNLSRPRLRTSRPLRERREGADTAPADPSGEIRVDVVRAGRSPSTGRATAPRPQRQARATESPQRCEDTHIGSALAGVMHLLPTRSELHRQTLAIMQQLRQLGDRDPYYGVARRIAVLANLGERYRAEVARVFREASHRDDLRNPGAYVVAAIRTKAAELGIDWNELGSVKKGKR